MPPVAIPDNEGFLDKLKRKAKYYPLIPPSLGFIFWAFYNGVKAVRSGDQFRSQLMMRYRVGGQAVTIAMIMIGYHFEYGGVFDFHSPTISRDDNNSQK